MTEQIILASPKMWTKARGILREYEENPNLNQVKIRILQLLLLLKKLSRNLAAALLSGKFGAQRFQIAWDNILQEITDSDSEA